MCLQVLMVNNGKQASSKQKNKQSERKQKAILGARPQAIYEIGLRNRLMMLAGVTQLWVPGDSGRPLESLF